MFTIVYSANGTNVTAQAQTLSIAPNNNRTKSQSIWINAGIGGGGQLGKGIEVPITAISSITVTEV